MGQSTKLIASCVGSTNVTKYVGFDEKLKEKSFDLMMIVTGRENREPVS